jgi:FMN-dependent NADH-azoreductase
MKLLHIDSSIVGDASVTRQLTAAVVAAYRDAVPGIEVSYRDVAAQPVPHLTALTTGRVPLPADLDPAVAADIALGKEILEEFLAADVIVVGAPMYNFSLPTQLRAWIDRICVAGRTFTYTAEGPKGLAGGKTVVVASGRGGLYSPGNPAAAIDFQEPYLKAVFGFVGITDVRFVRAEGVGLGPESRAAAIAAALAVAHDVAETPVAA